LFKASASRPCHCLVLAVAIAHRPIYISPLTLCTCPIRPALSTRGGWKIICISLCLLFCLFSAPQPRQSCPVPFPRFLSHSLCLFLSLSLSLRAPVPHPHTVTRVLLGHIKISHFFPLIPTPSHAPRPARTHFPPLFASAVGAQQGVSVRYSHLSIYLFCFPLTRRERGPGSGGGGGGGGGRRKGQQDEGRQRKEGENSQSKADGVCVCVCV
jgi:hypothetical protein